MCLIIRYRRCPSPLLFIDSFVLSQRLLVFEGCNGTWSAVRCLLLTRGRYSVPSPAKHYLFPVWEFTYSLLVGCWPWQHHKHARYYIFEEAYPLSNERLVYRKCRAIYLFSGGLWESKYCDTHGMPHPEPQCLQQKYLGLRVILMTEYPLQLPMLLPELGNTFES